MVEAGLSSLLNFKAMTSKYKNKISGQYRSKLEEQFARFLTDNGIDYKYEQLKVPLIRPSPKHSIVYDRPLRLRTIYYTPDFCGDGWCVEVKGMETPAYRLKLHMLTHIMNWPLFILKRKKDFNVALQFIQENIGKSTELPYKPSPFMVTQD